MPAPIWMSYAKEEAPTENSHFRVSLRGLTQDNDGIWSPSWGDTVYLPLTDADGNAWAFDVVQEWMEESCTCCGAPEKTEVVSVVFVE